MTVREYIEALVVLVKENPKALDMQAVTASDDKGSGFVVVHYAPLIGEYKNRQFNSQAIENANAVCFN